MKIDVYCDETYPDLFSSKKPQATYLLIGSVWIDKKNREQFKEEIHQLRDKYKIGGEFKWTKISPSRADFYLALIEWFFSKGDQVRFRCIAIDHRQVDLIKYHESDQELGFYKFYYHMLKQWILDFNSYYIFCDYKSNRIHNRLHTLKKCLQCTNLSASVDNVQATKSKDSVLLQLTDVLTGITSARLNEKLIENSTKSLIVDSVESKLGRTIDHTWRSENKFNVFKIILNGEF